VTQAHERMTSLCLPCLERTQISVMEASSTCLSGDDIERILEETLSDSESSLFDSDDDSSAIEDLITHEASDSDSVGNSTRPL
jgi:hypothetical protein